MNKYKILTLGASGAGKTVFLASMFKLLSTPSKHGFFIGCEDKDQRKEKLLTDIYAELTDRKIWPEATLGEIAQWNFICYVKNQELANYPVCQFSYLDFAGGLLTDYNNDQEEDDFNFSQAVSEVDSVLAIIDGYKLLSFMKTKDFNRKDIAIFLHREMPRIMHLVNKCNKNVPVHFIISKWDLLQNQYSLKDIKKKLEKVYEFKNVVDTRKSAGCSVFLIPVSSVGYGFANILPDGQMKINGVMPKPFQVEVPLALILVDKISDQINGRQSQSSKNTRQTNTSSKFTIAIYFLIGILLIFIFNIFAIILISIYMLFQNSTKRKINRKIENLSDEQALSQIRTRCNYIREEFLARFPDANLGAK